LTDATFNRLGTVTFERPAPDVTKLLGYWEEWERGETPPGQVLANLKTHGMPELLHHLVEREYRIDA
jgi:hypothetical protein